MKNITFKLGLFAILLCCVSACASDDTTDNEVKPDPSSTEYDQFIAKSDVSVWADGSILKSYDKSTDQVVYNDNKTIFMLTNDDYSSQFTLTISGSYTLDGTVTVNYTSNISDSIKSGSSKMTVAKIDENDGKYWLWNSDTNIGFIVDFEY
ncbi:MAG: hypothetical protein SNI51_01915 [Rikenellaceae bacterium]